MFIMIYSAIIYLSVGHRSKYVIILVLMTVQLLGLIAKVDWHTSLDWRLIYTTTYLTILYLLYVSFNKLSKAGWIEGQERGKNPIQNVMDISCLLMCLTEMVVIADYV